MAKEIFKIEEHKSHDKFFDILGPGKDDRFIKINYDDVDHKKVDAVVIKMVKILNEQWKKPVIPTVPPELRKFETWFRKTFNKIAEADSNGETIEEIEFNGVDPMVINFTVDCGDRGLHRDNTIKITKDQKVIMDLCGPIEGGDIDGQFRRAIEEKLKKIWR